MIDVSCDIYFKGLCIATPWYDGSCVVLCLKTTEPSKVHTAHEPVRKMQGYPVGEGIRRASHERSGDLFPAAVCPVQPCNDLLSCLAQSSYGNVQAVRGIGHQHDLLFVC